MCEGFLYFSILKVSRFFCSCGKCAFYSSICYSIFIVSASKFWQFKQQSFSKIYLFFLAMYFQTEERQKDLPSTGSYTIWLQWLKPSHPKVRSQELSCGFTHKWRVLNFWVILHYLQRSEAESWKGSGTARARTGINMGSQLQKTGLFDWSSAPNP